jgi:hypothetical protein
MMTERVPIETTGSTIFYLCCMNKSIRTSVAVNPESFISNEKH